VADNGSGFVLDKPSPEPARDRVISGYGITNIRSRLQQIGGNVQIISQPGEGTRVELSVPLPQIRHATNGK